ncbi:Mrp/NBP35 family ATP-binding protein [Paeniglutamicibacter psychrophenolicus]|uniref:Mrp/NBP35 family ATP-binding protein n=1 Tax=Paeniglutamicibacter psychrophenolicus TaxID=257454 RepID=UPI00278B30B3|nr:Mrp/NBP35 family ATP-binding protein [Paeniglutamicibacter psychrophenolicus]MDQ0095429.1 ATP-binding protein involved in chromosome partitioning [Paeniglutamicibacter psychrophenolicus]
MSLEPRLLEALATVQDPELRRPITELGMVESAVLADGAAHVKVLLTIAGCPMRSTIESDVSAALAGLPGVSEVKLELGVMSPAQRAELRGSLKSRAVPFSDPSSLTRVIGIASGKGGVGKSSLTANLACAMAADGLRVGLIDADVHGFSIPGLLGIPEVKPTRVDEMILPPVAHGVKVISIGMFVPDNKPVIWRGPMLHRALEQFLTDVHFGDLDVLLLDLPPGTGDIAISVSQLLPGSELVVVTTPQAAAAQVAERAGSIAVQTGQKVVGVIENMSWLVLPDGSTMEVFGAGGGAELAKRLELVLGTEVPLLGQVALDPMLRAGGDAGVPLVLSHPESPAAVQIVAMSRALTRRPRGLAGLKLGVTPV